MLTNSLSESSFSYRVESGQPGQSARAGEISTPHGKVKTPTFMPVGTRATVKAVGPDDLEGVGAGIVLSNTYHLMLRPGEKLVNQFGGLHKFMGWNGPILTDSGGYQVYSLAKLRKMDEQGVTFQSHIDGSRHFLGPERAVEIQETLGVDIMMCLDECTTYPAERAAAEKSMELTHRWAKRCIEAKSPEKQTALFGIVQGGMYEDLRKRSADVIGSLGFDGHAIGGLALGEPMEVRLQMIEAAASILPKDRPLYLMGIGTPEDLVEGVRRGADMFDCVMPTRNARNGQFFTRTGRVVIKNAKNREDERPIDETCGCYTCRRFSKGYLRHLYICEELLAYRLGTIHNLYYYLSLLAEAREAIMAGRFDEFADEFYRLRSG